MIEAALSIPATVARPLHSALASRRGCKHVIIVGGGASGVLLACHLLRDPSRSLAVTLIEKRPKVGCGIAYGTADRLHLLNVRAANMSAYADEPDHFLRWLAANRARESTSCLDAFCFVPRRVYGHYIAGLIAPLLANSERPGRLHLVRGECVSIEESSSGVGVTLADGSRYTGHIAVLATGHEVPATTAAACYADPWTPSDAAMHRDGTVLVLGTGLTMVDHVLTLIHSGH